MPTFHRPDGIVRLTNNHNQLRGHDSTAYLMVNGNSVENSFDATSMDTDIEPPTVPNGNSLSAASTVVSIKTVDCSKQCAAWTQFERLLILVLLLLVFIIVVLCLALFITHSVYADSLLVCNSPGCVRAASNILSSINTELDPCDDFYEYACSAWNRDHPIPEDMAAYGTFAFVRKRVQQQIKTLFESDTDGDLHNSNAIRMVKLAYAKCMNITDLRRLGGQPMVDALKTLGGWPLLLDNQPASDNINATSERITQLLSLARKKFGTESFFSMYVYADAKNTENNVLYLDQGALTLGRGTKDYYLNDTLFGRHMNAYKRYVRGVASLIAFDSNANVTVDYKQIDEMIDFERQLAKILVSEEERRNHTELYNKYTIAGVQSKLIQYINWTQFFVQSSPADVHKYIHSNTSLIVAAPDYFKDLDLLLRNTSGTVLSNYILWRVTHSWVKLLDDRYDIERQKFIRVMTGQEQMSSRWKECVMGPLTWLPLASGSLYVREHFDKKDKQEALNMIMHLRSAFSTIVMKLDWMDAQTKLVAIEKAEGMLNHIGYPNFIRDDTKLDEHYKLLNVKANDTYFDTVHKVAIWAQTREMLRLMKKFDKNEFEVSPAVVNAFYSPEKNAITFPAGILQPPFFSGQFPKSINYGAIGAVIGHEITHGFDDQGSQFDKDGNLKNWWLEASMKGFQQRKECIIKQYNNYTVPVINKNVNGQLTQGENIADNGGVKEAYLAYRNYIDEQGSEELRLPGLVNYTNNQLFFLSYAQFWCGQKKPQFAMQQVMTDEHSPEVFRVIGVLSNLHAFADAFQCALGTRMNPTPSESTKCDVW